MRHQRPEICGHGQRSHLSYNIPVLKRVCWGCGVVAWIALFPGSALGQRVSGRFAPTPESPKARAAQHEPAVQPVPLVPTEVMELGELTSEELSRKPRLGALYLGVRRTVAQEASQYVRSILTANGRRVLRVALHSNSASAIRIHFTGFDAGDGEVWIYAADGTRSSRLLIDGPYSGRGPLSGGDFWSATIHSSTLVVEFDAPRDSSLSDFPFRIDAISHQWATADTSLTNGPAPCELDVSCYPDWAKYASGVPLVAFMADAGGAYACSGVMLNTSNQIFEPYMLTANLIEDLVMRDGA